MTKPAQVPIKEGRVMCANKGTPLLLACVLCENYRGTPGDYVMCGKDVEK